MSDVRALPREGHATARPMPESPPVMTARLPRRRSLPTQVSAPWSAGGVSSASLPGHSCCWAGSCSGRSLMVASSRRGCGGTAAPGASTHAPCWPRRTRPLPGHSRVGARADAAVSKLGRSDAGPPGVARWGHNRGGGVRTPPGPPRERRHPCDTTVTPRPATTRSPRACSTLAEAMRALADRATEADGRPALEELARIAIERVPGAHVGQPDDAARPPGSRPRRRRTTRPCVRTIAPVRDRLRARAWMPCSTTRCT